MWYRSLAVERMLSLKLLPVLDAPHKRRDPFTRRTRVRFQDRRLICPQMYRGLCFP